MNKVLKNGLIAFGVLILLYFFVVIYSAYNFSRANIQEGDSNFQHTQTEALNHKNP